VSTPTSTTTHTAPATATEYMALRELAERLRLKPAEVRRYCRAGRIPPPDVSISPRNQLWTRSRIEDWLRNQQAPPWSPPPAEDPLTRLLRKALAGTNDPSLRRWLERLLQGDGAAGNGTAGG